MAFKPSPTPDARKKSISLKVLLGMLLFSSILALLLTGSHFYQDYRSDLALIDSYRDAVQQYAAPVLSKSLEESDVALTKAVLDAIVRVPYTAFIAIHAPDGRLLFSSGTPPDATAQPDSSVLLQHSTEPSPLGILSIHADHAQLTAMHKKRFLNTLSPLFLQALLSSLFAMALVYFVVSRHLVRISRYISGDNFSPEPLSLSRHRGNDELQLVADSLNQYRENNQQQVRQLKQEISSRVKSEVELETKSQLVDSLFQSVPRFSLVLDAKNLVRHANHTLTSYLAIDEAEINGKSIDELLIFNPIASKLQDSDQPISELINAKQKEKLEGYCQFIINGLPRKPFPALLDFIPLLADDNFLGCAFIISDESNLKYLTNMAYHASHDYLTGAYNRHHFDRELEKVLNGQHDGSASTYSIGLLDIDSFKRINELFGHAKGDEVLIHVTQTLRSHFGLDKLIARQGADEFIFLLPMSLDEAHAQCTRMLKELAEITFYSGEHSFHISASIGLAPVSSETDTVSSAIAKADRGCYHIKGIGGGNVETVKSQEATKAIEEQLREYKIIDIFHKAIKQDGLILYAQPILPLRNDDTLPARAEILARLTYNGVMEMPDNFIPAMERGRAVHLLDRAIFELLATYIQDGRIDRHSHLNVNLSPFSIHDWATQKTALRLLEIARNHDVDITFEVTENALVSHFSRIQEVTHILRKAGGKIAVDDFGKGLASYAYLEQLEIDMIKIDGSLVRRMDKDKKIRAIIASIQSIADSTGTVTVAEHVESERARQMLLEIGVDYSQSYVDGKPQPILADKQG